MKFNFAVLLVLIILVTDINTRIRKIHRKSSHRSSTHEDLTKNMYFNYVKECTTQLLKKGAPQLKDNDIKKCMPPEWKKPELSTKEDQDAINFAEAIKEQKYGWKHISKKSGPGIRYVCALKVLRENLIAFHSKWGNGTERTPSRRRLLFISTGSKKYDWKWDKFIKENDEIIKLGAEQIHIGKVKIKIPVPEAKDKELQFIQDTLKKDFKYNFDFFDSLKSKIFSLRDILTVQQTMTFMTCASNLAEFQPKVPVVNEYKKKMSEMHTNLGWVKVMTKLTCQYKVLQKADKLLDGAFKKGIKMQEKWKKIGGFYCLFVKTLGKTDTFYRRLRR